jgi:regulator of RNase E activity RraA
MNPELIQRWSQIPTTIASDIRSGAGLIDSAIRLLKPPGTVVNMAGLARTVQAEPPDFGAVLRGVDATQAGDVLVIAAGGDAQTAMIGEVLCGQLRKQGAVGLVCDGAVRDVGSLANFDDLLIYARHHTPRGPLSKERGVLNESVSVGGLVVHPGDLILGDEDGLICLTPEDVVGWIDAAEAQLSVETEWLRELDRGVSLSQLFGLDETG